MQTLELQVHNQNNTISVPQIDFLQKLQIKAVSPLLIGIYKPDSPHPLKHIIIPLNLYQQENSLNILYRAYGEPLTSLQTFQYAELQKQKFLQQILQIFVQFSTLKPWICFQQVYYMASNPVKILPGGVCTSEAQYIQNFQGIINKIYHDHKQIVAKCSQTTTIIQLQSWLHQLKPQNQGKTINQVIQLKNKQPKIAGLKIPVSQDQLTWIFTSIGFDKVPTMQMIYDGKANNFDPQLLLKAVQKQNVLFIIQNSQGKRVGFYPAIKLEHKPGLFGHYLPDKELKSTLLGLQTKTIHRLGDEKHALGLGNQILLSIGYCDIVLGAFNISNISMFPTSYLQDESKNITAEQLLGKQFFLSQLEAWLLK